jgi:hypothetical protein
MDEPRPLVASASVSTVTEASERPATDETTLTAGTPRPRLERVVLLLGLAAALVTIPFVTKGGVDETVASPGNTWVEIALTLIGVGVVVAGLFRARGRRRSGGVTLVLVFVLFALTAASIAWSVAPDSSWLASGQMLAYLAVFAAAVTMAQLAPGRWSDLLVALLLAAVAVSLWSLVVKVFPATLDVNDQYGRLQAPFGYWNALAIVAAMGVPCCLWLATRREISRWPAALTAPALALLVAVLVLSYSRSADLAAVIAAGLWLAYIPERLRAVAWLALGMLGGGAISAWALTHGALVHDNVSLAARSHAGHSFGIVVVVALVVTTGLGRWVAGRLATTQLSDRARRRVGLSLLGLLGLLVVAAIAGLATTSRGLTGQISHGWHELANPQAVVSATSANRVFQVGSSRPLYWHEALAVADHATAKGVGALGFSVARLHYYSGDPNTVFQAHSYVFETWADLGILGVVVSGALLAAWLVATGRSLAVGRRWPTLDAAQRAERTGLATLAIVAVCFGVQSTLDWTWYFAGAAVPALLAAGWLAGRGSLAGAAPAPARLRSPLDRPGTAVLATGLIALTLLGCWMVWRPLHSAQLVSAVENGTSSGAFASARAARSADPLSLAPYELLSALYTSAHQPAQARAQLVRATQVQPDNPNSWTQLAAFLVARHQWRAAIPSLHQTQVLDTTHDHLAVQNGLRINETLSHLPKG